MHLIQFKAYGHENVVGEHKTTIEITSEDYLTKRGTCIVGVRSIQRLSELPADIKQLATLVSTKIVLVMQVGDLKEEITGTGGERLTYSDSVSMVARTSTFQCDRTLMINADKAASDLSRNFIKLLQENDIEIDCELWFITTG